MAKGVTKIPERYRARVKFMGKYMLLGNFLTEKAAEERVRAAEKVIKSIESTASKSFEEWLGLSQALIKPAKPAKPTQKDALLYERLEAAVYIHSLMNYKGPEPVLAWGLDKLEEYILKNKPLTEAALAKQREQLEKIKEELSEMDDEPIYDLPSLEDVWTDEIWFEQRLKKRGGSLGKDKWGNPLIDGERDREPVIGFDKDGCYVEQNDVYNNIGEVMFNTLQEVEAHETAQEQAKTQVKTQVKTAPKPQKELQVGLPLYLYQPDNSRAVGHKGEVYLLDDYETMVDPDDSEYMTWISKRGVAEFKTEY